MSFLYAGQVARVAPGALLNDSLGLAAENLRASPYDVLPVLEGVAPTEEELYSGSRRVRVVGCLSEADLAQVAVRGRAPEKVEAAPQLHSALSTLRSPLSRAEQNGHSAAGFLTPKDPSVAMSGLQVGDVMRQCPCLPATLSLIDALELLNRYDVSALPVVDAGSWYRGMVSRSDVLAALTGQVRPPMVGGMATPMGVWLTTGSVSGGAPTAGLFLSGVVMALCLVISHLVMLTSLSFMNQEWGLLYYSGRLGAASDNGHILNLAVTLCEGLLFLLCLRALPMAGTHAAEHQTVWAIERGLPLVPEVVRQMPRAHPRCGTNLVALGALIRLIFQHLPGLSGGGIITALLVIYFGWRSLGTLLQERFTTRPATLRQLESGIKAGRQIMEKYQEQPHATQNLAMRLLNSGLLLSAAGMVLVLLASEYLEALLARQVLR